MLFLALIGSYVDFVDRSHFQLLASIPPPPFGCRDALFPFSFVFHSYSFHMGPTTSSLLSLPNVESGGGGFAPVDGSFGVASVVSPPSIRTFFRPVDANFATVMASRLSIDRHGHPFLSCTWSPAIQEPRLLLYHQSRISRFIGYS